VNVLGVSFFYHDSAACFIKDGKVVAAAPEERFIRSKNSPNFPIRPYAPAILEEEVNGFFEAKQFPPFMLLAADVKENKKSVIPAVTHVDGSARVQTVNKNTNPRFWNLIQEFGKITGIPVILNTSFNLRGEPIVCSPQDALSSFLRSEMDILVLGNFLLEK
jgi:carbamoyltransferase